MTTNRPLSGIIVLDLGRIISGPYATQLLADMGAEVIKVERPGGAGDEGRAYGPPFLQDRDNVDTTESAFYMSANRNKQAISVDISTARGQEIIRGLAAQSDVMLENFKVGDLQRYGLDYASIRKLNARIIYCSITGFGQTGPFADQPGQDLMIQALSGVMSLTGEEGGTPLRVGMAYGDVMAGMVAAYAIIAALYNRDARGGSGQCIDISILDATVTSLSHRAMAFLLSGKQPELLGNRTAAAVLAQDFDCADGKIMLQASQDAHFRRFCSAIGHRELAEDERYQHRRERFLNRHELIGIVQEILLTRTVDEWLKIFGEAKVMCAPINDMQHVFDHPQVKHRQLVVEVPHKLAGSARILRNPVRMSETPIDQYAAPPLMGEHTDRVLSDRLGLSAGAIAELRRSGVVA
jgi:crotonobetainyl-CoA:carnitine CoA-transferase CaiB-like acyl-CoA transferase